MPAKIFVLEHKDMLGKEKRSSVHVERVLHVPTVCFIYLRHCLYVPEGNTDLRLWKSRGGSHFK